MADRLIKQVKTQKRRKASKGTKTATDAVKNFLKKPFRYIVEFPLK